MHTGHCRLASGSDDRTVRVWDVRTGECTHVLLGSDTLLTNAVDSVSVNGEHVVVSERHSRSISVWRAAEEQRMILVHTTSIRAFVTHTVVQHNRVIVVGNTTAASRILDGHHHWVAAYDLKTGTSLFESSAVSDG